jgi:HK97 family phage prohead protease
MSKMQDLRFDAPLEVKFVGETGRFEGYASVFGVTDSVNDRIAPGAFQKSLATHAAEKRLPPLLWQHDAKQPIGAFAAVAEDAHGLFVRGTLFTEDIPRAREAWKLLREGVVTGLSIGYRARESFRDDKTGVRVLTDIELLEISMVTFPANAQARVACVKSALAEGRMPTCKEFEAFLRDAGLSRKQAKGFVAQGYKSLFPREAEEEGDVHDDAQALRALAATIHSLIIQ